MMGEKNSKLAVLKKMNKIKLPKLLLWSVWSYAAVQHGAGWTLNTITFRNTPLGFMISFYTSANIKQL